MLQYLRPAAYATASAVDSNLAQYSEATVSLRLFTVHWIMDAAKACVMAVRSAMLL